MKCFICMVEFRAVTPASFVVKSYNRETKQPCIKTYNVCPKCAFSVEDAILTLASEQFERDHPETKD